VSDVSVQFVGFTKWSNATNGAKVGSNILCSLSWNIMYLKQFKVILSPREIHPFYFPRCRFLIRNNTATGTKWRHNFKTITLRPLESQVVKVLFILSPDLVLQEMWKYSLCSFLVGLKDPRIYMPSKVFFTMWSSPVRLRWMTYFVSLLFTNLLCSVIHLFF
jgi:hypothetical protein